MDLSNGLSRGKEFNVAYCCKMERVPFRQRLVVVGGAPLTLSCTKRGKAGWSVQQAEKKGRSFFSRETGTSIQKTGKKKISPRRAGRMCEGKGLRAYQRKNTAFKEGKNFLQSREYGIKGGSWRRVPKKGRD